MIAMVLPSLVLYDKSPDAPYTPPFFLNVKTPFSPLSTGDLSVNQPSLHAGKTCHDVSMLRVRLEKLILSSGTSPISG